MPPQEAPSPGIKWNTVTWYSQIAAIVIGVTVFFTGFYVGKEYEKTQTIPVIVSTPISTDKVNLLQNFSYRDEEGWNISNAYATNGTEVYFIKSQRWDISTQDLIKMEVDKDSFQVVFESLQYAWAKDKNKVYFFHLPMPGIDAATLEVPADEYSNLEERNNYVKDKNHLYRLKEGFDIYAHSDASQAYEIVR